MTSIEDALGPLTRDPVCGRELTRTQALLTADYDGYGYLFCSERCRMLFSLRPEMFAVGGTRAIVERELQA